MMAKILEWIKSIPRWVVWLAVPPALAVLGRLALRLFWTPRPPAVGSKPMTEIEGQVAIKKIEERARAEHDRISAEVSDAKKKILAFTRGSK